MMKRVKRRSFSILISAAVMLLCSTLVQAQVVSYDPVLQQVTRPAGSTYSYAISVLNDDGFREIVLNVGVTDISEDIQGTYRLEPAGSTDYSLTEWTTVEPRVLTIPPGERREVVVTVNVPRGIYGGRYGAVVFGPAVDADSGAGSSVEVTPLRMQFASFLELTIPGGRTRKEAFIANMTVGPSRDFYDIRTRVGDNAVVYSVDVTNAGNIHVVAKGELMIRSDEGRVVSRNPIGGGRGVILPDSTVALRAITRATLPAGDYTARVVVDYGGRRPAVSEMDFTVTAQEVRSTEIGQAEMTRLWLEPNELEIPVRAGAFNSAIVSITNQGAEPVEIDSRLQKLEFSLTGDFVPEEDRGQFPDWITLNPEAFTIQPGRTQRVRVTLRPPAETVGGHYGDLVFEGRTETATTEVGSNLLVFVGADIERIGTVQFTEMLKEDDAIHFDCLFVNEGNYHLDTEVNFALRRVIPEYVDEETGRVFPRQTETLHVVNIPSGGNPVLPGTERLYRFSVPLALGAGEYEVVVRVSYGGEEPAMDGIGMIFDEGEDIDD